MIKLTEQAIDVPQLLAPMRRPNSGAVVLFLGVTRRFTAQRETVRLSYEAYQDMAMAQLGRLEAEARERWRLCECVIVHRLGEVPPGEDSVAIAVSSPHRAAAFEAGQWLIDTLKQSIPIWKQEHWADGDSEWIHPSVETQTKSDVD